MKYELLMWIYFFVKWVPGYFGSMLRTKFIPFSKIGSGVCVLEGVQIDKPSLLTIGDRVSINRLCTINAGGGVSIEDDVLIGPGVVIYSQNHRFSDATLPISSQGYSYAPVVIKKGAWLCANSIILPGVVVGEGAVVAAGSVVTKNVDDYSVVAGNPAKFLKSR